MLHDNKPNEYQPVCEWGRDPLYSSYRKLMIRTIKNDIEVVELKGLFHLYLFKRGISKAEIVGVVVSVCCHNNRAVYQIDDGTGCIRCVQYFNENQNVLTPVVPELGELVSIKGTLVLSESNEEPYGFAIHGKIIEPLNDPNAEPYHWLMCMHLLQSEYMKQVPLCGK